MWWASPHNCLWMTLSGMPLSYILSSPQLFHSFVSPILTCLAWNSECIYKNEGSWWGKTLNILSFSSFPLSIYPNGSVTIILFQSCVSQSGLYKKWIYANINITSPCSPNVTLSESRLESLNSCQDQFTSDCKLRCHLTTNVLLAFALNDINLLESEMLPPSQIIYNDAGFRNNWIPSVRKNKCLLKCSFKGQANEVSMKFDVNGIGWILPRSDSVPDNSFRRIEPFLGNCHFDKQITFKLKTKCLLLSIRCFGRVN